MSERPGESYYCRACSRVFIAPAAESTCPLCGSSDVGQPPSGMFETSEEMSPLAEQAPSPPPPKDKKKPKG